ncbi:hypothetical protein J6590_025882 [Homalodisca vitripennis]|nr:hypothetical protein J6590_025882 [Homalodisca vitripennis]
MPEDFGREGCVLTPPDGRQSELARLRSVAEEALRRAVGENAAHEERRGVLEGELKVEREWRQSVQGTIVSERDKIATLQQEISQLKAVANKYVELQEEHYRLSEQCREQELTLEELGTQLSRSKLQVSELKEEASVTRSVADALWTSDKEVSHCKACSKEFNITRRKHHCRHCGGIFCNSCSDNSMSLASSAKPVRVCDDCYVLLVARNSVVH